MGENVNLEMTERLNFMIRLKVLKRKHAVSILLAITFTKLNQIIKGWINYFRIGSMKMFIDNFGQWLRYKVRVIIIKKWKKLMRIYIQGSKL